MKLAVSGHLRPAVFARCENLCSCWDPGLLAPLPVSLVTSCCFVMSDLRHAPYSACSQPRPAKNKPRSCRFHAPPDAPLFFLRGPCWAVQARSSVRQLRSMCIKVNTYIHAGSLTAANIRQYYSSPTNLCLKSQQGVTKRVLLLVLLYYCCIAR